ncbi:hypothetical protein ANMWB30_23480 [Arthrobacter sp. MWB30]|nr:hypothetical protein ANMWB30_23480 [Arthrobacter sp. MWB30]
MPYLMPQYQSWSVDECLGLVSDSKASRDDWKQLGELFLRALDKAHTTDS